jgi:hypothetical protein
MLTDVVERPPRPASGRSRDRRFYREFAPGLGRIVVAGPWRGWTETMQIADPYSPNGQYVYECRECMTRVRSETRVPGCPECNGAVQNIAVPRE